MQKGGVSFDRIGDMNFAVSAFQSQMRAHRLKLGGRWAMALYQAAFAPFFPGALEDSVVKITVATPSCAA